MILINCFENIISDNINSYFNKLRYKTNKIINNNNFKKIGNYLIVYYNRFRLNINCLNKNTIVLDDLTKKLYNRKRYKYNLINIGYINYKLITNLNLSNKYFHYPKFILYLNDKNKYYFCYNKNHFIIKNNKLDLRGKRDLFIKNLIETIEYLHKRNIRMFNLDFDDFIYDNKDNRFKIWRLYKNINNEKLIKMPESYLKNYNLIEEKNWDKENIWQLGLMIFKIFNKDYLQINSIKEYLNAICIGPKSINYSTKKFNNEYIEYLVKKESFSFCNKNIYRRSFTDLKLLNLLFENILVYDYKKRFNIKQIKNSLYYKSLYIL